MKKILQVKNLTLAFEGKSYPVLKNVSFDLNEKETLGIVGESGSGKSVLCQSLVKLVPLKHSGEALFLGEDLLKKSLSDLSSYRGSQIAYIFQDPMSSLNPTMKIGNQIMEALPKKSSAMVYDLLTSVGISNPKLRFSQYPHELSGGQRQRIMIAIALAMKPKLLIADEPTTALDITVQSEILALLKDFQKNLGMSIIFISHDLKIVSSLASRILVMYSGEVVEEGSSEQIINEPKHPYTKLLLKSIPTLAAKNLYSISGVPPEFSALPHGCSFCSRCPCPKEKCFKTKPLFFTIKDHKAACWQYEDQC